MLCVTIDHQLDRSIAFADWSVWLRRADLDGAFGPDAVRHFQSCTVQYTRGPEFFLAALAAASNVTLRGENVALQTMVVVRPHMKNMAPPGMVCKQLAHGLQAYTMTAGGIAPHPALFHTRRLVYTVLSRSDCPQLTFANPSNRRDANEPCSKLISASACVEPDPLRRALPRLGWPQDSQRGRARP